MGEFDDAAAREWLDKMGWLALDDLVAKHQVTKILALVREHTRDAIAFREAWSEQDEGLVSHATAVQRAQQAAYTEGRAAVDDERAAVVAFGRNKPAPGNRAVWAFVAEVERGEHLEASDAS